MRTIIIEDEVNAARNIIAILKEVAPEIEILSVLDSVKSSVDYFKNNPMPDLVFMDIQLADGDSFSIFKEADITCPVIFTTAYDSYALDAFKVNSIDYLLKPIEPEHVLQALKKLRQLSKADIEGYSKQISDLFFKEDQYHRTFLVNFRDKMIPVSAEDIAFFYTSDNKTILMLLSGKEYRIDKTLETLMSHLNPGLFFRANRQFIISHKAVKEVVIWFGNRLSVSLSVPSPERIIISKARVSVFKKWIQNNPR